MNNCNLFLFMKRKKTNKQKTKVKKKFFNVSFNCCSLKEPQSESVRESVRMKKKKKKPDRRRVVVRTPPHHSAQWVDG